MPRVLRIINRFNLGGPTYNVAYLSRYMAPEYETLLVGGMKDETEESSDFIVKNLGLEPLIVEEMKREIDLVNDWKAYRKIKKLIREFRPDIVHTHASKAGTLGRLAASACGVPVIVHTFHGHVFHSYFGKLKTAFYKTIERYLARKSTVIIAISEKQKYELSEVYSICPASHIRVVPLGFDLSRFTESKKEKRNSWRGRYAVAEDEIAISIIGRLVPIKNHRLFIDAVQFVKQHSKKKIRAFIIGDGEERQQVEAMCHSAGLSCCDALKENKTADVTFTSWSREIDVVCAGSDIIALTSFNEGTPVSLIEAQAAGKAVVSTKVGGIENIVSPDTALLSEPGDAQGFCSNLLQVVEHDELRERMGRKGWDMVGKTYHYTSLVGNMKKLYSELLRAAGR